VRKLKAGALRLDLDNALWQSLKLNKSNPASTIETSLSIDDKSDEGDLFLHLDIQMVL
jgi:hypothetical protein